MSEFDELTKLKESVRRSIVNGLVIMLCGSLASALIIVFGLRALIGDCK